MEPETNKKNQSRRESNQESRPIQEIRKNSSQQKKQKFFGNRYLKTRTFQEKFTLYTDEKLSLLRVILSLTRTLILGVIPWALLWGVYGVIVSYLTHHKHLVVFNDIKALPNLVLCLNLVLNLLLIFRTNAAQERFWEGRKLWGGLVNTVRNLTRKMSIIIEEQEPPDRVEKEATMQLVIAFAVAMKQHLRREPPNSELAFLMSSSQYHELQHVNHPPLKIALWIEDYLQYQYKREYIDVYQLTALNKLLDEMVNILGGCERILRTPVPLVYTITLKLLFVIYFLVLPWEMAHGLAWWTGPLLAILCFILLSIDEIATEIEEPFGSGSNDLPLDIICISMQRNFEYLYLRSPLVRQK